MIDPKMKSLGFKQMHPMQVEVLMDFIATTLNLAALTNDQDVIDETEATANEIVRLFGGNGIKLTIESY
jgi:hypothetical protein|tara:strand:- start:4525 stop:4731 length:207 start_codon:yes stop_codon:yes gene_type:complete